MSVLQARPTVRAVKANVAHAFVKRRGAGLGVRIFRALYALAVTYTLLELASVTLEARAPIRPRKPCLA